MTTMTMASKTATRLPARWLSLVLLLLSLLVLCSPVSSASSDLRHDASTSMSYSSSHSLLNNLFALAVNTGRGIMQALLGWPKDDVTEPASVETVSQQPPPGVTRIVAFEDAKLPDAPTGATLVQLYACAGVNATVPMLVSDGWNSVERQRTIERVFITQHGAAYDPEEYFAYVNKYVADDQATLVIAPAFCRTNTRSAPSSYYLPDVNLAWSARPDEWPVGTNAAAPRLALSNAKSTSCSSFDTFDSLLDILSDKTVFPNLARVTIMGHSGGGNMVSRYAQLNDREPGNLHVRYLVMNPANHAFLTDARPVAGAETCSKAFTYPYQLGSTRARNVPSWVAAQLSSLLGGSGIGKSSTQQLFTRWIARDVVLLVGDRDTAKTGTQKCQSVVQGGSARCQRNYGFWTYVNILAGRAEQMKDAFGYVQLIESGAKPLVTEPTAFNHQYCVVAGVAHDEPGLLASTCGQAALFQDRLPGG